MIYLIHVDNGYGHSKAYLVEGPEIDLYGHFDRFKRIHKDFTDFRVFIQQLCSDHGFKDLEGKFERVYTE